MKPTISVLICSYNRSPLLADALESLSCQDAMEQFHIEIVVVDDGSTDDTASVVQQWHDVSPHPLRYVQGTGQGIAAARNMALEHASGEWVAFFDDDQVAGPEWLLSLWEAHRAVNAVCIGGARLLKLPPSELRQLSRITRGILGEIPQETRSRRCRRHDLVCTGNLLLSRQVCVGVGGFDPSLTRGGEDTDVILRIRRAGFECWYTPDAVVWHVIPPYRLESKYLRWAAYRGGESYAERDYRDWGRTRTLLTAFLRMGHAIAVHGFWFAAAGLTGNTSERVGRTCQIIRAGAYARHACRVALSREYTKGKASRATDFRSERNLFQNTW